MGDDLPIINYKGPTQKKHLDATTLSRIRSHAQQAVQDQKWVDRANKAEAKAARQAERASREAAKRHPAHGMQFIFETKSGREVKRAVQRKRKGNRAMEREKESPLTDDEAGLEVVQRESHSLSASPAERPDPFGSFPVEINAEFMNLFYGCKSLEEAGFKSKLISCRLSELEMGFTASGAALSRKHVPSCPRT